MWETSCSLGLFPLSSFPYWKCSFCGNVGNQLAGATGSEHLGCYTLACSSEAQMRMEKEREREKIYSKYGLWISSTLQGHLAPLNSSLDGALNIQICAFTTARLLQSSPCQPNHDAYQYAVRTPRCSRMLPRTFR